jgi:AcrR family transcriptional regulator
MAGSIDRATIVAAARRILETEGLGALSMRRLAADLGSKPMTLYYYVPTKDDLVFAALGEIAAEIEWTPPTGPPRDRLLQIMVDMAERLAEIGWVVDLLRSGVHVGPPALVLTDRFLDAVEELGGTPAQAIALWRSCWYLVASELQWTRAVGSRTADERSWYETIDPAALDASPRVRELLPRWRELSDAYDLGEALAQQIDGAVARFGSAPPR